MNCQNILNENLIKTNINKKKWRIINYVVIILWNQNLFKN